MSSGTLCSASARRRRLPRSLSMTAGLRSPALCATGDSADAAPPPSAAGAGRQAAPGDPPGGVHQSAARQRKTDIALRSLSPLRAAGKKVIISTRTHSWARSLSQTLATVGIRGRVYRPATRTIPRRRANNVRRNRVNERYHERSRPKLTSTLVKNGHVCLLFEDCEY